MPVKPADHDTALDEKKNILEILKLYREILWPEIEADLNFFRNFPPYCQIPSKYHDLLEFYNRINTDYPRRLGKYVRPVLVMLTAQSLGLEMEKTIKTAAAMEISEDWILIHDDVEDDSLVRRGVPALHRLYTKELAFNAGDALHILMWKILRDNQTLVGTDMTFRIIDEFLIMLNRTVLGQTVEIKWLQENKLDLTDEDILFILESKTGYYTIAGPMRLGAILAGASPQQLDKIYRFGTLLGYCFQIKDDLLDLTSDFAGLKKQTGNDIYEGKRTVMLLHLLRTIKGADRHKLLAILAKPREQKTSAEVDWVISMMDKYGSLAHAQELISRFSARAALYFDRNLGFISRQPYRGYIENFIDFVITRTH